MRACCKDRGPQRRTSRLFTIVIQAGSSGPPAARMAMCRDNLLGGLRRSRSCLQALRRKLSALSRRPVTPPITDNGVRTRRLGHLHRDLLPRLGTQVSSDSGPKASGQPHGRLYTEFGLRGSARLGAVLYLYEDRSSPIVGDWSWRMTVEYVPMDCARNCRYSGRFGSRNRSGA